MAKTSGSPWQQFATSQAELATSGVQLGATVGCELGLRLGSDVVGPGVGAAVGAAVGAQVTLQQVVWQYCAASSLTGVLELQHCDAAQAESPIGMLSTPHRAVGNGEGRDDGIALGPTEGSTAGGSDGEVDEAAVGGAVGEQVTPQHDAAQFRRTLMPQIGLQH